MTSKSDKELILLSLSKLKNYETPINKKKFLLNEHEKLNICSKKKKKKTQNFKQTINFVIVLDKRQTDLILTNKFHYWIISKKWRQNKSVYTA